MPRRFTRRQAVIGGSAALALACGKPAPKGPRPIHPDDYDHATTIDFDPASIPENAARFSLGVQAGAMRDASAMLWSFTETPTPATLRVWRELDTPGQVALVTEQPLTPEPGGFLRTTVDSLAPATWYRFGVFATDFTSRAALGRFRTAYPDDWNEPLTLGASTCTNWRMMPYQALSLTAQQPLDFFVHLGDLAYMDATPAAQNLYDFRAKWKTTLQDPGYRALLTTCGWYACWDDHEFTNDVDPEALNQTDPTFIPTAKKSFFESLAIERGGANDQLWGQSYRWGKTAEVFVMDCRTERKPSTRDTPDAQYISPEQLAWLTDAVIHSPCHFKILLNSVPISALPPIWASSIDRWQGYPAQREKLLQAFDDAGVNNVWFLTGDFHLSMVLRVEKEGPRRRHWEILVGPGGNTGNPLVFVLDSGTPQDKENAFPAAQVAWAHGGIAATTLTFDPKDDSVRVRYLDPATGDVFWDEVLRSSES